MYHVFDMNFPKKAFVWNHHCAQELPEFHAHSFIHFVEFDHLDHQQTWMCDAKAHQRIILLLFFSIKPHLFGSSH